MAHEYIFVFGSKCGLLSIDASPLKAAKEVKINLDEVGINSELIKGEQFKTKYPMLKYENGTGAVLEQEAGVLMANKCGQAFRVCKRHRPNRLKFVLPISSHMTILLGSLSIILLCTRSTSLHGTKYVREIKRCFIKRLVT